MGLWDKLTGELVDIIEWLDDTGDTLMYRFPRYENQIKYGAQLIVREGQVAAFVKEGKLADVFFPGTYTLETQNLPLLSTLAGWKYGFNSPFKAEVYFVATKVFTDRKWGTKNPIMLRDAEFGPVRLRAFGTFALKVRDPAAFLRTCVGTDSRFTLDELGDQLRDTVLSRFADILGESKIPALDLAGNYDRLGQYIQDKMQPDFNLFGLELVRLVIENISLPPEVEAAIDKRTSMGVIGNLGAYSQFQAANAMEAAAKNPGGGAAAAGIGAGAGFALAGQMAQAFAPGTGTPPPVPGGGSFYLAVNGQQTGPFDLAKLQEMAGKGEFHRQTLVWKAGLVNWMPAEQVPELKPLLATVPPPPPKA